MRPPNLRRAAKTLGLAIPPTLFCVRRRGDRMSVLQCSNWQSRSVALGHERPIHDVRVMSAMSPIATRSPRRTKSRSGPLGDKVQRSKKASELRKMFNWRVGRARGRARPLARASLPMPALPFCGWPSLLRQRGVSHRITEPHMRGLVHNRKWAANVRDGSLATELRWSRNVRFTPESDQIAAPH
jgi:hypothetical protein